ncbi:hypothetical protein DPMN_181512 [Dreissena polymorpha]|uniref:Uncharacterized protein n=1 Tax=Dreissena polymorpha TaxID=45954 RepID=A0A9D4DEL4_DREPO|nr:hypothetical protein DPMN_181512 [Dreissena polymorpha]
MNTDSIHRNVCIRKPLHLNKVVTNELPTVTARSLAHTMTVMTCQGGVSSAYCQCWVRFNESDHSQAIMVLPGNNRRATITGFIRERRSSVDRTLFDILSSDRSQPLTPRLLVA